MIISRYEFDPEKAVEIIRDLGYTYPGEGGPVRTNEDGDRLTVELIYPETGLHSQIAQAIETNWSALGYDVTLLALPYQEVLNRLDYRDYEAALVDLNLTSMPDPDPYPFWHQAQATGGKITPCGMTARPVNTSSRPALSWTLLKEQGYTKIFRFAFTINCRHFRSIIRFTHMGFPPTLRVFGSVRFLSPRIAWIPSRIGISS